MTRPAAPANLRNGLKWRDGRPRWEPSPANRALGFSGLDLRGHDGGWMSRGQAMDAADLRTRWAKVVRDALRDDDAGGAARRDLRRALDALDRMDPPADPAARHLRQLVADLIERGRAVLEDREPGMTAALAGGPRTVNAMVDGYFADVDRGRIRLAAATRRAYFVQSRKLKARFGTWRVDEVTRPKIATWYEELVAAHSLQTAAQAIGAAGAMFNWASLQDPAWIERSPVFKIGVRKAGGRRVFWTVEEEAAFIPWCDANGFEDVADAVAACLWTGARQIDVCRATLADLSGPTWRFVPQKTEKRGQEALPGLLQPVKARVERRRQAVLAAPVRAINDPPFLWDARNNRRHTSDSIGARFREARAAAIEARAMPAAFAGKRLQDTRDTCVTRLFLAGVATDRIPPWTGHSAKERDQILVDHYLVLRNEGALETAAKLEAWARAAGVVL